MARLRTFGALELSDAAGHTIDAILARQRRVALLVYLAVEGRGGFVRRESLFRVFWPELDQARARAALRQSLYVLRSEVGEDVVVARGAEEVGVSAALECDATKFEEQAAAGRFTDARALYRGPFLNAFFISDAPEFERWVDERRDTFRRRAAACEQQLAAAARERGDLTAATAHLRQALELEPTDEATLRQLMRVLESASDRGAALREYAQYAEQLRRDYEIEPSAETHGLAEEIRESGRGTERTHGQRPSPGIATTRTSPGGALAQATPTSSRLPLFAAVAVIIAVIAVLATFRATRSTDNTDRNEPRLVVMPFTVRGGAELTYLGEGMSDLLSTSLDGPDLFRAVPPAIVLRDARERSPDATEPNAARAAARRLGASHFVSGSLIAAEGRVRFDARLYASGVASPVAEAMVEGSPDSIFALVDRLTAQLIAASLGRAPAERLRGSAAMTTRSLGALREYLGGERALRAGAFGSAVEFFRRAVAVDSTFALAYYRMSMAAEWLGEPEQALAAAAAANRHARRLSVRDGALLRAHYTMLRGADEDAEQQYRAILAAYPDDAEAWLKTGEIRFHNNPRRGRPLAEARAPFLHVLSYAPAHRAALLHLVRIAAFERDLPQLDSLSRRYLALGIADGSLGVRLVVASARRDSSALVALARSSKGDADEAITDAARDAFMYGRNAAAALAVLEANLASTRGTERRVLTHLQMAVIEQTRGRRNAARQHFQMAAGIGSPESVHLLQALYALHADPHTTTAELTALRDTLAARRPSAGSGAVRTPLMLALLAAAPVLRASLLAEIALRLGDTTGARRIARDIEALPVTASAAMVHQQVVHLTRARLAGAERRSDVVLKELQAIRRPSGDLPANWGFPWHAAQRQAHADALIANKLEREAVELLTSFEFQSLFLYPFAPIGFLRAAQLKEMGGDSAGATRDYARAVEFWADAEPEYRESVARAKGRMAALSARAR
ncbi:MAG: BTAD domain-containing putative transcriptional regulator [Gemmatimonadota bacterium]